MQCQIRHALCCYHGENGFLFYVNQITRNPAKPTQLAFLETHVLNSRIVHVGESSEEIMFLMKIQIRRRIWIKGSNDFHAKNCSWASQRFTAKKNIVFLKNLSPLDGNHCSTLWQALHTWLLLQLFKMHYHCIFKSSGHYRVPNSLCKQQLCTIEKLRLVVKKKAKKLYFYNWEMAKGYSIKK